MGGYRSIIKSVHSILSPVNKLVNNHQLSWFVSCLEGADGILVGG